MTHNDRKPPMISAPSASDEATRRQMMAQNGRNLNYIGNARLMAVLGAAVRHAVKKTLDQALPEETLARIADVTQRGFVHLMRSNSKAVRGLQVKDFVREVEETKNRILAQREQARLELNRLRRELDEREAEMRCEREAFVLDQKAEAEVADTDLVVKLEELFGGMESTPELEALREAVTQAALQGVHGERAKALQTKLGEHDSEVDNYKRRISKLTESLSRTEAEIARLAGMKDVETGVASIYRTVQGLSHEDENAESKKEMMMAIFEANLSLQDQID